MTSKRFLEHPLYMRAKQIWERVRIEQIDKGEKKYPEPLNPDSWTAQQLIEHGIQENVDQLHYFVALLDKVEKMESSYKQEKTMRVYAEERAHKAEKALDNLTSVSDRERRKIANMGR